MSDIPLPLPGSLGLIQFAGVDMHAYAAAVSAADNARLRGVLEFIAGHDLNGADDRAKAIICGLFIIKAKKAIHGSQP